MKKGNAFAGRVSHRGENGSVFYVASFDISEELRLAQDATPVYLIFAPAEAQQGGYTVALAEGGALRAVGPQRSLREIRTGEKDLPNVHYEVFGAGQLLVLQRHGLTVERYRELVEEAARLLLETSAANG